MPQQVVIIGGGPSGQNLAKALLKKKLDVKVTLVTATNYCEWPIAMPYVLCKPEEHYKALATNPKKFEAPGVEYKYGVVDSVDREKKEVILKNLETLSYDILVVAPGFAAPVVYPKLGATLAERKAEVQEVGAAIKSASHVLIGGGGPISLDLAGAVRAHHADKKVTIVCSSLLPQWPHEDRVLIESQLEKMQITVKKVAERCPNEPKLEACTVGEVLGDVYLPGFGQGPNTEFLRESGLLDESGKVKVNKYLQAAEGIDVFAIGVSDFPTSFIGLAKLEGQWSSVAANVEAQIKGKPLVEHKESMPGMKRPPVVLVGTGKDGWAFVDFAQMPLPAKVCCCNGYCGFPCCPLVCCWPCTGCCLCGYCCGQPHGNGVPKFIETMQFKMGAKHFNGLGEEKPEQQKMA